MDPKSEIVLHDAMYCIKPPFAIAWLKNPSNIGICLLKGRKQSGNKNGKLSQNTQVSPQVITIHEIS